MQQSHNEKFPSQAMQGPLCPSMGQFLDLAPFVLPPCPLISVICPWEDGQGGIFLVIFHVFTMEHIPFLFMVAGIGAQCVQPVVWLDTKKNVFVWKPMHDHQTCHYGCFTHKPTEQVLRRPQRQ